jgi:hypothetical protein
MLFLSVLSTQPANMPVVAHAGDTGKFIFSVLLNLFVVYVYSQNVAVISGKTSKLPQSYI